VLTGKIFFKLIAGVLVLLAVALVAVDFLASRVAETNYLETLQRELEHKARMAAIALPANAGAERDGLRAMAAAADARLTWIGSEGQVLADTEASPTRMDNHRGRPEVDAALAGRTGAARRKSSTVGVDFLYVAVPAAHGALRAAVPLAEVRDRVNEVRKRMLAATALAFLPAMALALLFARFTARRLGGIIGFASELARGNFRASIPNPPRDELGLLEDKLNETGGKLAAMFQELEREHSELEKLERVRKDFVINVSHELRTPLASIQGYTETLLDGALEDPSHNRRFLNIIRQNAERLANLTADLLTLSRVEMNQQKFHFGPQELDCVLASVIDTMAPLAARKNLTLELHHPEDPVDAYCDPEAVSQIVTNLIDNALKYTPEGGSITLGIRPSASQEMVEVYVRDTGAGIPEEELPRLFERFYRVDKARSRELGGTGLGLAIVKHIVRAHGGEVGVSSRLGAGTEFTFTLPRQELPGPAAPENSSTVHSVVTEL
jgi:two-component system, OmpR family, phosphate regulon sensor histidine kinase PhoR